MSELLPYAEVEKTKKEFFMNLIQKQMEGLFTDSLNSQILEHGRPRASLDELFVEHFESDKSIGSVHHDDLMHIAAMCLAYARTDDESSLLKRDALELAASAMQEAAVVETINTHNAVATVDERLRSIDAADNLMSAALTRYNADPEHSLRLMLKQAFTNVYKDIVCGEITTDTIEDLLDDLRHLHSEASVLTLAEAAGLRGEIRVFQDLWGNYKKQGQLVALPATIRGGNGKFMPHQTHDIDTLRQKIDGSWIVLRGIEVKSRKEENLEDSIKQRYTESVLAHVRPGHPIHYSTEHRAIKGR